MTITDPHNADQAMVLIQRLIEQGYLVTVHNLEPGEKAKVKKANDLGQIMSALGTSAQDNLKFHHVKKPGQRGWAVLTYGAPKLVSSAQTSDPVIADALGADALGLEVKATSTKNLRQQDRDALGPIIDTIMARKRDR